MGKPLSRRIESKRSGSGLSVWLTRRIAVYLAQDTIAGFCAQIAQLCTEHCDFSKPHFDPMGLN